VRAAYNLNAQTSETSEIVITDGTLEANTSQNGLLGAQLRVKYTVAGDYVGATFAIDVTSDQLK
jgi:hypothetical protein